jgi:Sulfotransferase family
LRLRTGTIGADEGEERVAGDSEEVLSTERAAPKTTGVAPIFVIGSPRSGTTLLRLILDSHARISCGEETHFLRDLEAVVGRDWDLVATYGLAREWWIEHLRGLYESFQAEVLARNGKARWAEKDPTYTLHLPFIEELFPGAVYVHLLRDGHDVVASFRDRWGYTSAARAARTEWARYVTAARALGARLPTERFLELRYEELVADPETQARRLFAFLGEAWDPAVLEFDPRDHRATERYQWFTAQRRAAGGEEHTIYRSRVGAGGRSLDPLLRTLLRRRHGELLRTLGYQR